MKFIVDAQLPKRLSTLLKNLSADAIYTLDLPAKNRTGDDTIIKIALEENRIVDTKDSDFSGAIFNKISLPNYAW
jgi:predicted nuclease of predicted toxin-antitoxin system